MVLRKVALIGDNRVGKSCFMVRLTQDHFVVEYQPRHSNSYRKMVTIGDKTVVLDILEAPTNDRCFEEQCLMIGDCILLMFSLQNRKSLDYLSYYYCFMKSHGLQQRTMLLLGMKCDLKERQVSDDEILEVSKAMQIPYYECSSKDRTNIDLITNEFVQTMEERAHLFPQSPSTPQRPRKKKKKQSTCILC